VIAMFERPARGLADVVLPGTSYLERDGTYVNLEGRLQRLRRAVPPPAPDELGWLSKLGERFGVDISPFAPLEFEELSTLIYDELAFGEVGEQAPLPARRPSGEPIDPPKRKRAARTTGLRLVTYRPLFSGPAVERVAELQFQRPEPVLELSPDDARARGIEPGNEVELRANELSARLRARISRKLPKGTVRAAEEHVRGLGHDVLLVKR
jgi:predicted molibdopterin-dependent oxidoreductase YjgC